MKKTLIALAIMASPSLALADNGPGCGMGAELWKGKSGLVAHTSAGTTNTTFSSPLSGLLSGTSGCDNPGVVANDYQQKLFVAFNLDDLAQDIAKGNGDHLSSLASLLKVADEDQAAFYALTQRNYDQIFASSTSDYQSVLTALNQLITSDDAH